MGCREDQHCVDPDGSQVLNRQGFSRLSPLKRKSLPYTGSLAMYSISVTLDLVHLRLMEGVGKGISISRKQLHTEPAATVVQAWC